MGGFESSGDQNPTMFMLHFMSFLAFLTHQKRDENARFSKTLQIKDSWDHAQMIERNKNVPIELDKSSVRPNPALVFAKLFFQLCYV